MKISDAKREERGGKLKDMTKGPNIWGKK